LQSLLEEKELRRSTQSLIQFIRKTLPKYQPAKHHYLIAEKLEQVEQGLIDRLIICLPPRHGKTEEASLKFPPFFIGRNPEKQIICCSYSDDMATDFGRQVRNTIASEEFANIFPHVSLAADSKSANRWNTNKKGSYVAAGVGGGITGKGAHILLIDDPIKDREEADSEVTREKVWNWYTGVAYTRLMPGGAVILIQTRWHDDDLAGRLIDQMEKGEGDQWEVINLPAIAMENDPLQRQPGEALWPEWYDLEALNRIKNVLPSRDWNSLYQQNPIPDEGDYFKREWFQWYSRQDLPKELKMYGASDYAVTEAGGDYTEHGVFGVDEKDDLYIVDWWYGQTSPEKWISELMRLTKRYSPLAWAEESGQIQKSVGPFIDKRQREEANYFYRKQYASSKDKPTRAQSFRGRAAQGKVFLPKNTDWADRLLHQLIRFPAGKHDDAVDVCSLLSRMLAELVKVPVKKKKQTGKFPHQMTINEILQQRSRRRRQEEEEWA
jgi:predicted phage terminase large subunit-like protein